MRRQVKCKFKNTNTKRKRRTTVEQIVESGLRLNGVDVRCQTAGGWLVRVNHCNMAQRLQLAER